MVSSNERKRQMTEEMKTKLLTSLYGIVVLYSNGNEGMISGGEKGEIPALFISEENAAKAFTAVVAQIESGQAHYLAPDKSITVVGVRLKLFKYQKTLTEIKINALDSDPRPA